MNRRDLARQYREEPPPAGVYRVTHASSGRVLLGSSHNVQAALNRIRAELTFGSYRNQQLQSDWNADGENGFTFEVLDTLPPADDPSDDIDADLRTLLDLWRERLQISADAAY